MLVVMVVVRAVVVVVEVIPHVVGVWMAHRVHTAAVTQMGTLVMVLVLLLLMLM